MNNNFQQLSCIARQYVNQNFEFRLFFIIRIFEIISFYAIWPEFKSCLRPHTSKFQLLLVLELTNSLEQVFKNSKEPCD